MSLNSHAARRDATHTIRPAAPAPAQRPAARAPSARQGFFVKAESDDSFKLNLSDLDLPRTQEMEVEGLKPSLLSRLVDLISPLK